MDFKNDIFQSFLKKKDSEVEKLLSYKHLEAAKYVIFNNQIQKVISYRKSLYFTEKGLALERSYIYNFYQYLEDKLDYTRNYFLNIPGKQTLDFIRRKAEFYYGQENVWLDDNKNAVIIHFPEIVLTNSIQDSHLLKDVFIKIDVNKRFYNISIARTTVDLIEYEYIFSHVAGSTPGQWHSNLCFGSTELNSWIFNARNTNNFILIDKIIASLYGYLSWESLEGKPYKYIANFKKHKVNGTKASHYIDNLDNILKKLYESNIKLQYKITSDNYDTKVKITNIKEIESLISQYSDEYSNNNGVSYCLLEKRKYDIPTSNIVFKETTIPVVIEDNYEFSYEKSCHIKLLKDIIATIEEKLFNLLIKRENE